MKKVILLLVLSIFIGGSIVADEVKKNVQNDFTVKGEKVEYIIYKEYDSVQNIVIVKGFYTEDSVKIKGTENRYFKLSEMIDNYFTEDELNKLKGLKNE